MKRQVTASTARLGTSKGRAPAGGGPGTITASGGDADAGRSRPLLTSVRTRPHTLILTGELNNRSALTLEAEIERVYEDGVTDITLDLRQLERIDAIGVAVITFRCGLSRRRGFGFALIPGPPAIHEVFVQAGVAESLPFTGVEAA